MRGKTGFDDFPGRVYVPFACYFGRLSVLCRTRDADLPERRGAGGGGGVRYLGREPWAVTRAALVDSHRTPWR